MFSITDDFPLPPGPIHTIFILSGWFYIADAYMIQLKNFMIMIIFILPPSSFFIKYII